MPRPVINEFNAAKLEAMYGESLLPRCVLIPIESTSASERWAVSLTSSDVGAGIGVGVDDGCEVKAPIRPPPPPEQPVARLPSPTLRKMIEAELKCRIVDRAPLHGAWGLEKVMFTSCLRMFGRARDLI